VKSTSLTVRQLGALVAVYARELTWIAPRVAREVRVWRERAEAIPDPALREDALVSLRRERLNIEGAALFAVLPPRRELALLRLLVAYQVVLDFLDTLTERVSGYPPEPAQQLHRALVEALDPSLPQSDYYRCFPWPADDGGYLTALVQACRRGCMALPGYPLVRERAVAAGARFAVQVANHDPQPGRRDATLIAWAEGEGSAGTDATWYELAAASSSTLGIHALLALAAEASPAPRDVAAVDRAYYPWVCAASTLLDSFVDQADDLRTGDHNYLVHYASEEAAVGRLEEILVRSVLEALRLPRGGRHATIVCGMVAMYLSKASVEEPRLRPVADRLLASAGGLATLEVPILGVLRRRHDLRSA
jgi:tetraprenyl-beta-curcumene synthase